MATWSPWNSMEALRRDIDRAFTNAGLTTEPFFRTAFLPGQAARRYPLVNLHEDHDHLYIEAFAPGLDPASIDLAVLRNTLTIAGEKRVIQRRFSRRPSIGANGRRGSLSVPLNSPWKWMPNRCRRSISLGCCWSP